jgi:hypothetical protein
MNFDDTAGPGPMQHRLPHHPLSNDYDEADKSSMGNNPEIEALWDGVVAAYRAGGRLAEQRDAGVRRELEEIARLFDAVTAGSNDPEIVWWRFLDGKGVRRGKRRGRRLLFYGLIEHLSNEHASQDEIRSKSIISRRAGVLQHWHDQERAKVPADQVAGWIATNGGVKAVAAIANPPKPTMTEAERKAARADRDAWLHQLAERDPLTSMNWDVLPDNLRPFADGTYRLALIRVWKTDADDGAVDIIGMAEDSQVSQRWLNRNAQGIVERLTAACRDCEAAEDRVGVIGGDSTPTFH